MGCGVFLFNGVNLEIIWGCWSKGGCFCCFLGGVCLGSDRDGKSYCCVRGREGWIVEIICWSCRVEREYGEVV